jgi:hypothetical protein
MVAGLVVGTHRRTAREGEGEGNDNRRLKGETPSGISTAQLCG